MRCMSSSPYVLRHRRSIVLGLMESLADEGRAIEREVGVENAIPGCCRARVEGDAEDVGDEGRREAHELVCGVPKAV